MEGINRNYKGILFFPGNSPFWGALTKISFSSEVQSVMTSLVRACALSRGRDCSFP